MCSFELPSKIEDKQTLSAGKRMALFCCYLSTFKLSAIHAYYPILVYYILWNFEEILKKYFFFSFGVKCLKHVGHFKFENEIDYHMYPLAIWRSINPVIYYLFVCIFINEDTQAYHCACCLRDVTKLRPSVFGYLGNRIREIGNLQIPGHP